MEKLFVKGYGIYMLLLNPYPDTEHWKESVGKFMPHHRRKWKSIGDKIKLRSIEVGSLYIPSTSKLLLPSKEFFPFTSQELQDWAKSKDYPIKWHSGAESFIKYVE